MIQKYYLGIDNGGTVTKAAIYDINGTEIGLCSKQANVIIPHEGFVERNCDELLDSVRVCIQGVIAKTQIRSTDIVAVSVSCHGKGLYLLGNDNTPAYNGILSSDSRAGTVTQQLQQAGIADTLYRISFQQLWTGHPVALLKWFSYHNPKVIDDTKHIFMGHDYIRYYLTGEASAEMTNMSGSGLVDVAHKTYSDEILTTLQLQNIKDKLPPLVESTQQCGDITKNVSQETGLVKGTPVYSGFFDVVSSAISSGLVRNNEISATMGTWAIATCISDLICKSDYPYIWGNYCLKDTYFAHEGSPTSASNLDWFVKAFIGNDGNIFERCNTMVSEANNDDRLLFFPFLYASNISSTDTMGASFMGLQSHHTKADVVKAIYEGIIFAHTMHLERLYSIMDAVSHITLVGGPSNSDVWMQMFADITGHKIIIPNCKEAGCKGVAMAAMVGSGAYQDFNEVIAQTVKPLQSFVPHADNTQYYQDKYAYYKIVGKARTALQRKILNLHHKGAIEHHE